MSCSAQEINAPRQLRSLRRYKAKRRHVRFVTAVRPEEETGSDLVLDFQTSLMVKVFQKVFLYFASKDMYAYVSRDNCPFLCLLSCQFPLQ